MHISILGRIALFCGIALFLAPTLWSTPAASQYEESNRAEFPGRRVGGGTRGECMSGSQPLVAFNPANNLGVTGSHSPSLYFSMPELHETQPVEFVLRDSDENLVYETTFEVKTTDTIVGVHLPEGQVDMDQDYHWYFSVICEPQDRSQNIVLTGWLRRVPLAVSVPEAMTNEMDLESSLEQVMFYQDAGLWTDAIATLVELRQAHPDDGRVLAQWTDLLQILELDAVFESSLAIHP